ncbi:hypothetical protein LCGC14_3022670, partial [marine sediment metagenome]
LVLREKAPVLEVVLAFQGMEEALSPC